MAEDQGSGSGSESGSRGGTGKPKPITPADLLEIPVNKPELRALYARIGGEAKLAAILEDFYERMSRDVLIGFFFDGKDLRKIATLQKQFLMRAMGAAPSYSGKAPADAHDEIAPILVGHFDRRLRVLQDVLRDHGLTEAEIEVWLAFENAFREAIVKPERGA